MFARKTPKILTNGMFELPFNYSQINIDRKPLYINHLYRFHTIGKLSNIYYFHLPINEAKGEFEFS